MVSNALNKRLRLSRPPVVCVSKPGVPRDPLVFDVWVGKDHLTTYESTPLYVFGDHPFYQRATHYDIEWDPGAGYIDPPPESYDEMQGSGTWGAPSYPCVTQIKAMATWPNGTKVFRSITITVTEPEP